MLLINECGFSGTAHEKMKEQISGLIGRGCRSYLIVPEQQTVTAEAEMARDLPECAPLYFEVTNFTRLSDGVFRSLGGVCRKEADSAAASLIMWRTLTELSPTLDMTRGRSDINAGLVKKALSAINELDGCAIDTEELIQLTESDKIGARLKSKLSDIALISALYRSLLAEKFTEGKDALPRCAAALSENPEYMSGTVFFVEGFTSFTEPQYRILGELMKRCELHLYLPLPKYESEGFEYREICHTRSRILSLADKCGCDKKSVKDLGFDLTRPQILNDVLRLIWRTSGEIDNDSLQNEQALRIFEAHTPFDECDFVCSDIKRRVMAGESYSDFAIIARTPDEYLGVLDVALEKAELPYFMSRTHDASEYEAVKFIYSAYSAADAFRREDVISYMKCGLSDVSRDEADEFEIYVERWGLSGHRLSGGEVWNMNPDGYTTRKREDADRELVRINETREKILSPLVTFAERTRGTHTVREHAEMLYEFLVEMKIEEKLGKREKASGTVGGISLWKIITDALDSIVEVLDDMTVTREVFASQLKILFSSVGIGRIPAVIDEVVVGGAEMLRLYGKRHIYLIGINQGKFPKSPKDESYFNEKDKATLASLNVNIAPDLELRCARELFFLSRAIGFAKESVTLSYSLSGTDFAALARADLITRLSAISGGKLKPVKISELAWLEKMYSPSPAKEMIVTLSGGEREAAERALTSCHHEPYPSAERDIDNGGIELHEGALSLIYGNDLALTQSRIDTYVKCPLNYFCKYNLGLEDTAPYEVSYSGIGSFVHAILENFFSHLEKEKIEVSELNREALERITYESAKKYTAVLYDDGGDVQTKIMLSRLYRATLPVVEDICSELRGSKFRPKFFELNIRRGGEDSPEPISFEYPEGRVSVYGQIDRVDTYHSGENLYVRVIDYKTGAKHFSPDDLKKGENLQMFLYLKSIVDSKNPKFSERIGLCGNEQLVPAGVIYVKTSLSDIKVGCDDGELVAASLKKAGERRGMILNDPEVIAAQSPEYLPVKFKKDGTPMATSEKYLYTPDGWEELMDTVKDIIGEVSHKMRSGQIKPIAKGGKNQKTPCEHCEYKPICRKSAYD